MDDLIFDELPEDFKIALEEYPGAKDIFMSKTPSFRKDYLSWILSAKTVETKNKRITEAVKWISEGKRRFWKYD